MADFYSFSAELVGFTFPTVNEAPTPREVVPLTMTLAAGASVTVPLTGLTAPVFLAVKGGTGITVALNSETAAHPANPLFVTTDKAGLTITKLIVANTGSVSVTITILAAE